MSRPSAKALMPYVQFVKADWRRQKKQRRYTMSPIDVAASGGTYDGMYRAHKRSYPPGKRRDVYERNYRIADNYTRCLVREYQARG